MQRYKQYKLYYVDEIKLFTSIKLANQHFAIKIEYVPIE